ncbi:MAG: hypothetical protein ACYC0Q_01655, partial [Eubacteriales bacterium]
ARYTSAYRKDAKSVKKAIEARYWMAQHQGITLAVPEIARILISGVVFIMTRISRCKKVILCCTTCGNEITVLRRTCRLKRPGHVEHMWCYRCQDTTVHIEKKA